MDRLPVAFALLGLLLAGCVSDGVPAAPEGQYRVFVAYGTVTEHGPAPDGGAVCDTAAPPWSFDPETRRLWIQEQEDWLTWQEPDVVVLRYDRIDATWDDGCWTPQLEQDRPVLVRVYDDERGMSVLAKLPFEDGAYPIDARHTGHRHGMQGSWTYDGALHIDDLGLWDKDDVRLVARHDQMPPTPWQYPIQ